MQTKTKQYSHGGKKITLKCLIYLIIKHKED